MGAPGCGRPRLLEPPRAVGAGRAGLSRAPCLPLPRVSLQKAGGGLRQWKRVYAALRARSLSLSKERREPGPAAAGAAAAVAGEDEAAPVCIGSCLVDISYSETKRRHVFRLTTADFCEYLFQAEDRDDMLGWIRAIRENSRAEGEVRARPPTRAGAGISREGGEPGPLLTCQCTSLCRSEPQFPQPENGLTGVHLVAVPTWALV